MPMVWLLLDLSLHLISSACILCLVCRAKPDHGSSMALEAEKLFPDEPDGPVIKTSTDVHICILSLADHYYGGRTSCGTHSGEMTW